MIYKLERIRIEGSGDKGVNELLERCSDYFVLCEGKEPGDETQKEIVSEVPEGWRTEDKTVLKIMDSGREIGLVDILRGYPEGGTWMIGLLLIDPEYRGRGVGRVIHKKIIEMAKMEDIKRFRIGVVEENTKARKFWCRLGYKGTKSVRAEINGMEKSIEVMVLDI